MKFIAKFWRPRRREQSPVHEERYARFAMYPRHRNVQAAPIRPPLRKKAK